jgi:putative phosphoribosyl transferase
MDEAAAASSSASPSVRALARRRADEEATMDQRQDTVGTYAWADHFARLYEDRSDAGAQLAGALRHYKDRDPLVLGIPRGGIPVAREVAGRLGAELDVIVARKLGAPHQSELAIGAVTADGTRVLNQSLIDMLEVPPAYLERVTAGQGEEAKRREAKFRPGLAPRMVRGRVVILVDDGLATGATVRACARALQGAHVKKLVVAVPVGAADACDALAAEVDELVCPWRPDPFFAVAAHYHRFEQVSDVEVERVLREYRAERSQAGAPAQRSERASSGVP